MTTLSLMINNENLFIDGVYSSRLVPAYINTLYARKGIGAILHFHGHSNLEILPKIVSLVTLFIITMTKNFSTTTYQWACHTSMPSNIEGGLVDNGDMYVNPS